MSSKIYQGKDDVLIDNPGGLSVTKALKIPVSDESGAPPFSSFYESSDAFVRINDTKKALEFFLDGTWHDAGHAEQFITTLKFFIGNGSPPANYIQKGLSTMLQDQNLIEAEIVGMMWIDNVPIEFDDAGILFNPITGVLDFSVMVNFYDGQKIIVVVKRDLSKISTLKFFIGSGTPPYNYKVKPLSTTIQDDGLKNVSVTGMIWLDNTPMDIDDSGIVFDPVLGKLDFGSLGQLYNGQKIVVITSSIEDV